MKRRNVWLFWMAVLPVWGAARAGEAPGAKPPPSKERPRTAAVKVASPPEIDGRIEDACWGEASRIDAFWRTDRDAPFPEATEALICYDDRAIYLAFRCQDSQPRLMRSQQRKRGGDLGQDDTIRIAIDPLNQSRSDGSPYEFAFNPAGTQSETIPGGAAAKVEWRGDWKAAARPTEKGWEAEAEIPFSILRIPKGQKRFGLRLERFLPQPRAVTGTFPYQRGEAQGTSDEWGDLEIPFFESPILTMRSMSFGAGGGGGGSVRSGIDVKQRLLSGLQWMATVNPEFESVEDSVETIDFTYSPRYLPDRRPFFTEGERYMPMSAVFGSRNIRNVQAGTKLFGKIRNLEVGAMGVRETEGSLSLATRMQYDLDRWAIAGLDFAHRTEGGGRPGWVGTLAASRPTRDKWVWNMRGHYGQAGSDVWQVHVDRQSPDQPGRVSFWLDYASIGHFQPSLGFFPENNFNVLGGGLDYYNRFDKGALSNYSAWLNVSRRTWRSGPDAGRLLDRNVSPGVYMAWRKGYDMNLGMDFYDRPPFRDRTRYVGLGWNTGDLYRKGGLSVNFGRRAGADYRFAALSQGFRLNPRLSARAGYERLEMAYPDRKETGDRWTVSGVYEITPERSLVFRWLFGSAPQPDRPEIRETFDNCYVGYRQSVRRGLDIYLLLGDPNARKTRARGLLKLIQVL